MLLACNYSPGIEQADSAPIQLCGLFGAFVGGNRGWDMDVLMLWSLWFCFTEWSCKAGDGSSRPAHLWNLLSTFFFVLQHLIRKSQAYVLYFEINIYLLCDADLSNIDGDALIEGQIPPTALFPWAAADLQKRDHWPLISTATTSNEFFCHQKKKKKNQTVPQSFIKINCPTSWNYYFLSQHSSINCF